jgi:hypothetical protein
MSGREVNVLDVYGVLELKVVLINFQGCHHVSRASLTPT